MGPKNVGRFDFVFYYFNKMMISRFIDITFFLQFLFSVLMSSFYVLKWF